MQIPACLSGGNWLVHNHIVICHIRLTRVMDVWRVALISGRHISYWGAAAAIPPGYSLHSQIHGVRTEIATGWTKSVNMQLQTKSKFILLWSHWTVLSHSIFITPQARIPPFSLECVTRGQLTLLQQHFLILSVFSSNVDAWSSLNAGLWTYLHITFAHFMCAYIRWCAHLLITGDLTYIVMKLCHGWYLFIAYVPDCDLKS
jgi:hypothetical protein